MLRRVIEKKKWAAALGAFHERNYPCDPIIWSYFGLAVDLDSVGERPSAPFFLEKKILSAHADGRVPRANTVWKSVHEAAHREPDATPSVPAPSAETLFKKKQIRARAVQEVTLPVHARPGAAGPI